jgi:hypothetical protein
VLKTGNFRRRKLKKRAVETEEEGMPRLAQIENNCASPTTNSANTAMSSTADLLQHLGIRERIDSIQLGCEPNPGYYRLTI